MWPVATTVEEEEAHIFERERASLAGSDRLPDIDREQASILGLQTIASGLSNSNQSAAYASLTHAGIGLLGWLISQAQAGYPIPDTLAELEPRVEDGRMLSGGSALTYSLTTPYRTECPTDRTKCPGDERPALQWAA